MTKHLVKRLIESDAVMLNDIYTYRFATYVVMDKSHKKNSELVLYTGVIGFGLFYEIYMIYTAKLSLFYIYGKYS
ncbi:hypothetical protein PE36_12782 [Moritella sp. PE36]|nr:hypothetical protein PE36_12782 [Moritella sp. PE36]